MTPDILIAGIGLFLVGWIVHIVIWGSLRVRKEILALVLIFLAMPWGVLFSMHQAGLLEFEKAFAAGLLAMSISLAYILTYPALKIQVPTLRILALIRDRGDKGMVLSEILESLKHDQELFRKKIRELEGDMLISVKNDTLRLTLLGKFLANLFVGYRKLLGLKTGLG